MSMIMIGISIFIILAIGAVVFGAMEDENKK